MIIRLATKNDTTAMVKLSDQKRQAYAKVQSQFWRQAKDANAQQQQYFNQLIEQNDKIILVAQQQTSIVGFVIGMTMPAPAVYDPGGLTLMIDDFCVKSHLDWSAIGKALIDNIKIMAIQRGVVQMVVVCGKHDKNKQKFLASIDLTIASLWYVGGI